jgi:hypothetical protein
LEVLDSDALGIERSRLMIFECARVLGEGRVPVSLRWLLNGDAIKLSVGADAERDAITVEAGLVREWAGGIGVSGSSRIRDPPCVGWELPYISTSVLTPVDVLVEKRAWHVFLPEA